MDQNFLVDSAYIWETLYERAITEADTALRRRRLQEAERAILERARVLDEEAGDHAPEAQALKEASEFIREMKLATQTDGLGKELETGDRELFPRKTAVRAAEGSEEGEKRGQS